MQLVPDNHSAQICMGVGGCGAHQQILAGPVASGDFTNIATNNAADGVYTLNGETVAIGAIIDFENPDTDMDPVIDIDAGGIKARDTGGGNYSGRVLELTPALVAQLLTGFTIVMEHTCGVAAPDGGAQITPHDAAWSLNTFAICDLTGTDLYALDSTEYYDTEYKPTPSADSKAAITMTPARMAISINGAIVHAIESGCLSGAIDNILLATGAGPVARLRSFAFYEPVDDADLPTLSAL